MGFWVKIHKIKLLQKMSSMITTNKFLPATLALADGTIFKAKSFGAPVTVTGEIVFNTGMTGYQEILTDPSYCGQLVTMTCPHIGNVQAFRTTS
jgi:carbamoylphosphate synthase small subunit